MFELILIIQKWIKPILLVAFLTAIAAAGGSMLIPNQYESSVIFKPSNTNLLGRNTIFSKEGSEQPFHPFGSKADISRVISIGRSNELYLDLVKEFKLYEHYKIDPNEKYAQFNVLKQLKKQYKILKNDLGSVIITVLDQDPEFASGMANRISDKIDELNRDMIYDKQAGILSILEQTIFEAQENIGGLRDSIFRLMKNSPNDTISVNMLELQLEELVEEKGNATISYEQNEKLLKQKISTFYYFERAVPADRKAKPKRSLLVLGAIAFALILMTFVAIFLEKFKEYKIS